MLKRFTVLLLAACLLAGCGAFNDKTEKIKDVDFAVLSEDEIPAELKTLIDEKKHQEFKMTYQDGDFLYICIGYGKMATGGYSIQVKELYETGNAVYAGALLLGPDPGDIDLSKKNSPSYPLIVLKTEWLNKSVVFK